MKMWALTWQIKLKLESTQQLYHLGQQVFSRWVMGEFLWYLLHPSPLVSNIVPQMFVLQFLPTVLAASAYSSMTLCCPHISLYCQSHAQSWSFPCGWQRATQSVTSKPSGRVSSASCDQLPTLFYKGCLWTSYTYDPLTLRHSSVLLYFLLQSSCSFTRHQDWSLSHQHFLKPDFKETNYMYSSGKN